MEFSIREWLNLGVRWFHVFAGIMWVGQTYYFTWLDGQFSKLEKRTAAGKSPEVWMVHSGGFYAVGKQQSLGVSAEQVRWFRWEALMTWLAGMVLLILVYYMGSGLIDADIADISQGRDRNRTRRAGGRMGHLRLCAPFAAETITGHVPYIRLGYDGNRLVGTDASA